MIALGIARSAIETLVGLAVEKRHERTSQSLREDRGAQSRLAQAEALVRSARLYLFDTVSRLWEDVMAGREATIEGRVQVRLASWHAVSSAAQAVDLVYLTGGATSLYESCLLERAFRDVHAATQHIGVHPRILETAGRVLFGLEPDTPTQCCDIRQGLSHDVVMLLFALHRQEDQLTNAVRVTAARLRIGMNAKVSGQGGGP